MNYDKILEKIQPSLEERNQIHQIYTKVINTLETIISDKGIDAKVSLVGSVAKETFLSGKSDIDIFIRFPLETDAKKLKRYGLDISYKCINKLNGKAEEHYASHPYLTGIINGYEIDFVPCYDIKDASQLKSAVDRTVLHTKYVKKHLKEEQKAEVLLLKKFMDEVGVYGSEFKTGGFAGYLCEILILEYGSFENVLENSQYWKYGTKLDLEDYGTWGNFKDPLVFIDPTDKNRNVGAALRIERMIDFIIASRNYLDEDDEDKKLEYFYPLQKENISKEGIVDSFKRRGNHNLVLRFRIPDFPQDSLYPQFKKTLDSFTLKLEKEEFKVFKSDYWSDDEEYAFFVFELNVSRQTNYKIHLGPKIWNKISCTNFKNAHKDKDIYILDESLVFNALREFKTADSFISHVLTEENIHKIKVGKNLLDNLINESSLMSLYEFLDSDSFENYKFKGEFLNFLDDFLNPNQYIIR